jgi:hypothetical protein
MSISLRGATAAVFAFTLMLGVSAPRAGAQDGVTVDVLMQRMAETLAGAESFSVHAEKLFDVVLLAGPKVQHSGAMDVEIRRPDRFYVSYGDDLSAKELWYDGKTLTIQDHIANVHGVVPAAGTIDATTALLGEKYGLFLPLAELFSTDSYGKYADAAGTRLYLGIHDVNDRPAHHILFTGERADWQIWIDAGEVPLPLKIVVNQFDTLGEPQQTIVLSEWDLEAALPDENFAAEISEGSVIAEFLTAKEEN